MGESQWACWLARAALSGSSRAIAVTGHGCRPCMVFQEFGHILSYSHPEKEHHSFRQRCTCTPAKWVGHSTPGLSFHWALFTAIGMLGARGTVGNLIHCACLLRGRPHQRLTALEAFVLAFLQQWLCGSLSLPLTNRGPQAPFRGRKSEQSDLFEERTNIWRTAWKDSGKNYRTFCLVLKGLWLWTTICWEKEKVFLKTESGQL